MPDNGFGTLANSADFLLRLCHVTAEWETAAGGSGEIHVGEFVSVRDPDGRLPFPIVNDGTPERLLTGADLDIESVVRQPDGSFWIGDEFGPFLVHVDATGKVLAPPVEFPDGRSPEHPLLEPGETARVRRSRGFEAIAASADGRTLYPIVEGSFIDDPVLRRRYIYEFDAVRSRYTGRTWQYEVDTDTNVIGDAFTVRHGRLRVIERDGPDGPAAVIKRIYEIDLRRPDRQGFVRKELVVDLLGIANPDLIGTETSPGAYGVGDPFAFPMVSVETMLPLRDGRPAAGFAASPGTPTGSATTVAMTMPTSSDAGPASTTSLPSGRRPTVGSAVRYPGTPDDTEMIVVDLRRVRPGRPDDGPIVVRHRGASGLRPEHTLAHDATGHPTFDRRSPDGPGSVRRHPYLRPQPVHAAP